MFAVCFIIYVSVFVLSYVLIRYKNGKLIDEFNVAMKHKGIWAKISYISGYYNPGGTGHSVDRTILLINYKRV